MRARAGRDIVGEALGPFLALAAVIAFFAAAELAREFSRECLEGGRTPAQFLAGYESRFLTARNARTVLVQASTVAAAALGMTLVIMAGGIDLSAGTALALAATVLALVLRAGQPAGLALAACALTGGLAGVANGVLISALRIVPFVITLGTMTFYVGLAKLVAGETTVRPAPGQVPDWLPALMTPRPRPAWLLIPAGVWLVVALTLVMQFVLRRTVFGRRLVALGSNEKAAYLSGIRVGRLKVATYALAGVFVGVAGILQFARLSSGNPTAGLGLELRMIAAVVLGGGSLRGGRGSMIGTFAGAGIMAVIASGCTMIELRNPVQDMVIGVILVATVLIDHLRRGRGESS
jgi:ribose transport system permease protein